MHMSGAQHCALTLQPPPAPVQLGAPAVHAPPMHFRPKQQSPSTLHESPAGLHGGGGVASVAHAARAVITARSATRMRLVNVLRTLSGLFAARCIAARCRQVRKHSAASPA